MLAVFAPKDSAAGIAAAAISTLAAALLISPLLRACGSAGNFRRAIEQGLGVAPRKRLIDFMTLWRPSISHRPPCERLVIEGAGGRLEIDFFRAKNANPAPLVVVVHGGGWVAGGAGELGGWNAWLAAGGYAVAAVDYRLVPTGAWPAQCEDVLVAVAHLRAVAPRLGIDSERVVFLGRSAGGQIASAIAATGGHRWLRGCVCFYSPFDMAFAYAHGSDDDLLRSRWLLRCFLGGTPEQEPAAYHGASAYLHAEKGAPPFLLLHGGRDELVWIAQSERFSRRLTELDVPHAFLRLPWATHAFDYNRNGPGGQIAAAGLEAFLRRVCGSENV